MRLIKYFLSTNSDNSKQLDFLDFYIKINKFFIVNMKIINKNLYYRHWKFSYRPVELITEYDTTETYLTNISLKSPMI